MTDLSRYRGDADYPWGRWWLKIKEAEPGWVKLIQVDTRGKASGIRKRINSGQSPFAPQGRYLAACRGTTVYARVAP